MKVTSSSVKDQISILQRKKNHHHRMTIQQKKKKKKKLFCFWAESFVGAALWRPVCNVVFVVQDPPPPHSWPPPTHNWPPQGCPHKADPPARHYIGQFKHQMLFATQTQTQRNLIMNTNPMYRICHTPISHWLRNLGYVPFELTLQFTFGA